MAGRLRRCDWRDWTIVPLLLSVGLLLVIVAGHRTERGTTRLPSVTARFPLLALAPLPGVPRLTDATLRAGHPTLVNLFASWCLPCRAEAPQLAALRTRGIVVAGIAVRDTPAATAAFLAATGTRYAALGLDPHERVQSALGSAGVPETWLVDGHGIVRARFRGDLHAADLAAVEAAVAASSSAPAP